MRIKNFFLFLLVIAFIFGCSHPDGGGGGDPEPTAEPGDTTAPTLTIFYGKQGDVNDTFTVAILFSEVVNGFTASDITAGNGSADNLTTSNDRLLRVEITPEPG